MSPALQSVTIVFLVYNRREELRVSLGEMITRSDYPSELLDVIVVDNASEDGAAEMVREEFPQVHLIVRDVNCGVSGWNDGFAVARGDYVLALDDDCYLPPDGLRRAVTEAQDRDADLVSFAVRSLDDPDYRFDLGYRTGLLTFWGCAVLMRRPVLERLRGYDPEVFVWANEVELMLRFFDAGFRHLHAPEIQAVHMKATARAWADNVGTPAHRMDSGNLAYSIGKHLRAWDAAHALVALLATNVRDGLRGRPAAVLTIPASVRGFRRGLQHRRPVRPEVSSVYRNHFVSFASPWWLSRPPLLFLSAVPGALVRRLLGRQRPSSHPGRMAEYFARGARYYPTSASTLEF